MIAARLKRYRHVWLTILFVSLMTAAAWGNTAAYLTDQDNKENPIAVGDNVIAVKEEFEPPEPGLSELFHKEVCIENTGTADCFVRVFLGFSDDEIARRAAVSWDNGETYRPFSDLPEDPPEHWIYMTESVDETSDLLSGYWYFTEKLCPGESAGPLSTDFRVLFETEHIKEKLAGNGYDIYVYAESVQTLDKDGAEWTGVDAWKNAWTEMLTRK